MGNPKIKLFFLPAVSLFVIFACALPSPENGNNIPQTQSILNTESVPSAETPFSTSTVIVIPATDTATLTPTTSYTPTIPYTPTPSIPMVTVSVGTNCREGPSRIYNLVDGLMVGEQAEIVRLAPAGVDYVVIKRPHEPGECWLWLRYATITGDVSRLPIASIPPTPTATNTPTPTPTATATPTTQSVFAGNWTMMVAGGSYAVTVTQAGTVLGGNFTTSSGNIVTFNGTLGSDGKSVVGTFTESGGAGGNFVWAIFDNLVQFNGHGISNNATFEWCGYGAGQSAPVPCLAP